MCRQNTTQHLKIPNNTCRKHTIVYHTSTSETSALKNLHIRTKKFKREEKPKTQKKKKSKQKEQKTHRVTANIARNSLHGAVDRIHLW